MVRLREANESRPQAAIPGAAKSFGGDYPQSTDPSTVLARADHALLVTRQIKGGKVRRRIMLSLDSAQRAAARADAAGHPAAITLVRLQPVGHIDLDDLEGGGQR